MSNSTQIINCTIAAIKDDIVEIEKELDNSSNWLLRARKLQSIIGAKEVIKDLEQLLRPVINNEYVSQWESCYRDNLLGDTWLINLFANEYFYLMDSYPNRGASLIDFSC